MSQNRRNFLKTAAAITGAALYSAQASKQAVAALPQKSGGVYINQYTVQTFYGRDGVNFGQNIDKCFAEMKEAGLAGFEAMTGQPSDLNNYFELLKKNELKLRSVYSGANLHDEKAAENEIKRLLAVAELAKKEAATEIIVINLQPKEGKTDEELNRQNQNLDTLGAGLRERGLKLAMHYHTTELQFSGRELHSFMWDTKPENVSLCYELHWSYRGSGNSAVSVYDHAKMYGNRSVEIHLRQSHDKIWTETFTAKDDIDSVHALSLLKKSGADFNNIHIVLEQAPETGTPKTLKPIEIFRQSVLNVEKMVEEIV